MVNIVFDCGGTKLSESNPLDFGTVQAGTSSAIKVITVTNTGNSDAQQCVIEAKEATVVNGFSQTTQIGTAEETYKAQQFASDSGSSQWYSYGVVGIGKNFTQKLGGTLTNTSGSDVVATKWTPPSAGTSGQKVWGNVFSCVYA